MPRDTRSRAASDSGIDARSITADTPDTPQSLVRSPARPSDTSIAALAWSRTISAMRHARLRHAIAPDQRVARGRIGCRGVDLSALENGKPQRGVADRARHHHALAGFCAAAMNHLARRHAAERGDRDHQRARRRNGVAAQQRTAELRWRPRRAPPRTALARLRRHRAAPASARSRPAWRPWPRDRKGSPAAPCARPCRADRRAGNGRPRRWRPSSPRCRRRRASAPRRRRRDRRRPGRSQAAGNSARSASPRRTRVSR